MCRERVMLVVQRVAMEATLGEVARWFGQLHSCVARPVVVVELALAYIR